MMSLENCGRDTGTIQERDSRNESDLPPEYCHYRDEGCEFDKSCLNCHFPRCIYEEPRGKQRWLKDKRNNEIIRLYGGGGWGVRELAQLFRLSQRTIQRALRNTSSNLSSGQENPEDGGPTLNKENKVL